jgi:hypothetical protein
MEHRWGERVTIDLPVRVTTHPFAVRPGKLTNLSVSGAQIRADFELRVLSRIYVTIDLPQRSKHEAPTVAAFVARKCKDGVGVEWCEFSPNAISELLRSLSTKRYGRSHRADPPATQLVARFSAPLLKHRR